MYLSENLRKYRMEKGYTQEEVAQVLGITPQSISKWERAESFPDITFLPAIANLYETSIDALIGMDTIRAEETRVRIHRTANELERNGAYAAAEQVYRDALKIYPNKPGMMLGLAGALALQKKYEEAIVWAEAGLSVSDNDAQKATVRAALCYLYLQCGKQEEAQRLAANLPHQRESREVVLPQILRRPDEAEIDAQIKYILLGEEK